jgi:hypothetical protein
MGDPSSEMPSAWAAGFLPPPVTVCWEGTKGDGLRTSSFVRRGQIIFTERPLVRVALPSAFPHCDHCCRSMCTFEWLSTGEVSARTSPVLNS